MVSDHLHQYFQFVQEHAIALDQSFSGELFLICGEYQYAPCIYYIYENLFYLVAYGWKHIGYIASR